jgi:hypothetical protein
MNWLKIDPKNLPEGEVIAASFYDNIGCEALVGTLYLDYDYNYPDFQRPDCTDNYRILRHCTHYIDISSIPNPDISSDTDFSNQSVELV